VKPDAFHQAPEEHLLPAWAEHGIGVIVWVALDEGGLTGRITLGSEADEIAGVALRYVLSRAAVSTVIAGMRTVRTVERNAAVGDGRGLSAGQQAIVARHRWSGTSTRSDGPARRRWCRRGSG
jgi:aryl-alcohol dehydrogenase-like predicted oxidoreductase